ncbi:hypothetical protein GCM10023340_01220 [Nocardioides marinquilinus]|uniref:Uncharacterized protein n=1 Tax=Nocardioides marinquilinus TaxID=1210400 RepID=A0ABP9P4Y7_9ACTN
MTTECSLVRRRTALLVPLVLSVVVPLLLAGPPAASADPAPDVHAAAPAFGATRLTWLPSAYGSEVDSFGQCPATGDFDSSSTALTANQPTTTTRHDQTLTVTDPDDPTDTSVFRSGATLTGRLQASGGRPTAIQVTSDLRVDGTFSKGTASGCISQGQSDFSIEVDAVVSVPTLVTMTTRVTGDPTGSTSVVGTSGSEYANLDGLPGRRQLTFVAQPGTYTFVQSSSTRLDNPVAADDPTSARGTTTLDVAFVAVGAATTPSRGTGTALVTLPGRLDCAARSVTAVLRTPAVDWRSATFFVNDERRALVAAPARGRRVVLARLPQLEDVVVRVVLVPKLGRTRTVTRAYASCGA